MKTLDPGNADYKDWWIGSTIQCPTCGRRVQLERGDEKLPFICIGNESLWITCENCATQHGRVRQP